MKRALLALAGVVVVLGAAGMALFVARPLRTLEVMGRAALRANGFTRGQLPGPRGPLVFFHAGNGPAIILLHGVNDQAGAWARVAPRLRAGRRVVVPDLPGHGQSAPAEGALAVAEVLAGVEALIVAESAAGPVDLVGNSMGGWLALLAARDHPARIRRVVLVNGAALRADDHGIRLLPRTRDEARAAVQAMFGPRGEDLPGFVLDDLVRRAPTSPLARMGPDPVEDRFVLDGRLGDIRPPAALVWGEADGLLTVEYARRVAAGLRGAPLRTLPGCGHVPQRECPEELMKALTDVLR